MHQHHDPPHGAPTTTTSTTITTAARPPLSQHNPQAQTPQQQQNQALPSDPFLAQMTMFARRRSVIAGAYVPVSVLGHGSFGIVLECDVVPPPSSSSSSSSNKNNKSSNADAGLLPNVESSSSSSSSLQAQPQPQRVAVKITRPEREFREIAFMEIRTLKWLESSEEQEKKQQRLENQKKKTATKKSASSSPNFSPVAAAEELCAHSPASDLGASPTCAVGYASEAAYAPSFVKLLRWHEWNRSVVLVFERLEDTLDDITFNAHLRLPPPAKQQQPQKPGVPTIGLISVLPTLQSKLTYLRSVATALMRALARLKRANVINGDIKPHNCMTTRDYTLSRFASIEVVVPPTPEQIRVIDFGSALCPQANPNRALHEYSQSRNYRAPEVLLGLAPLYSFAIDSWSAGVVLAEIALGHRFVRASNEVGALALLEARVGPIPRDLVEMSRKRSFLYDSRVVAAASMSSAPPAVDTTQPFETTTKLIEDVESVYSDSSNNGGGTPSPSSVHQQQQQQESSVFYVPKADTRVADRRPLGLMLRATFSLCGDDEIAAECDAIDAYVDLVTRLLSMDFRTRLDPVAALASHPFLVPPPVPAAASPAPPTPVASPVLRASSEASNNGAGAGNAGDADAAVAAINSVFVDAASRMADARADEILLDTAVRCRPTNTAASCSLSPQEPHPSPEMLDETRHLVESPQSLRFADVDEGADATPRMMMMMMMTDNNKQIEATSTLTSTGVSVSSSLSSLAPPSSSTANTQPYLATNSGSASPLHAATASSNNSTAVAAIGPATAVLALTANEASASAPAVVCLLPSDVMPLAAAAAAMKE